CHLGVLEIDRNQRIVGFEEKPKHPKPIPSNTQLVLASMGIYVFRTPVLIQSLLDDAGRDTSHDFGRNIIPNLIGNTNVYAFNFKDMNQKDAKYWRDVGTLDAYFDTNMDLISIDPQFNLYDKEWPIRTYVRCFRGRITADVSPDGPFFVVQIELRINGDEVHIRVKIGIQSANISPVFGILLVHVLEIERVDVCVPNQVRDDVAAEVVARVSA